MSDTARVEVRSADDVTVVSAHGEIFYGTHEPLLEALLDLAAQPVPLLVLDLAQVPVCDSTGLNVLLQAHRRATSNGGWLRLAAVQELVRQVLLITNLDRILPMYDSVAEATQDGR